MLSSPPPAVLLVDGYNIIGAWSCLQKTCKRDGLEAARDELIESITSYSAFVGYETHIVFDAHYQNTGGNKQVITGLVSVYYTDFGQTADTYIEKVCASMRTQLANSLVSRVIVATSDRAQQLVVQGYGAEWMSAQQLCFDVQVKVCNRRKTYRSRKQPQGRFLANSIDAKARQKLSELRMSL